MEWRSWRWSGVDSWEWEECHPFGATQDQDYDWIWHEFNCQEPPPICGEITLDPAICCGCLDGPDLCPEECMHVDEQCHGVLTCGFCPEVDFAQHEQCEIHIDEWGYCTPPCDEHNRWACAEPEQCESDDVGGQWVVDEWEDWSWSWWARAGDIRLAMLGTGAWLRRMGAVVR